MIPVTQTKMMVYNSKGEIVSFGNCWPAAIASVLELPLSEVPNIEVWFRWEDSFWWELSTRFLHASGYTIKDGNDFKVFHLSFTEWVKEKEGATSAEEYHMLKASLANEYYFITGPSPRGVSHVTIWQNGKMVWDPHPSRDGILELKIWEHIRPLNEEERTYVNDKSNYRHIPFPVPYKVER